MTDNDFRWLPVSASAPRQCLLWILKWEREDETLARDKVTRARKTMRNGAAISAAC